MGLSLNPLQRAALFSVAGLGYFGAFLGEATESTAQTAPASLRISAPAEPALIVVASSIKRDPFAPTPAPRPIAAAPEAPSDGIAFAPVPPGLTVPSIDGIFDARGSVPKTLSLKATIAGSMPVAYVADGRGMQIVRPGDTLAGLRVRAIDLHGIVFDDGTRLGLPERADAETPSATRARTRSAPSATETPVASPSPAAQAATAFPTPGPLPTPKPGAYPLGSRLTSDPAQPTAFPYPYPYAPH